MGVPNVIRYIGFVLVPIGLLLAVFLIFASAWKPHYRKIPISQKEFTRFIYLVGASTLVFGVGFVIITWEDSQPSNWLSKTSTGILCLGIFPLLMIGVYIYNMRRAGYVERTRREEQDED